MPLTNRVTPMGEIVAAPWRGGLVGNRGVLHVEGPDGPVMGRRLWAHQAWVACRLEFRGRWREPMLPGRWTALFFWDEAAAFAAGHLPCGECRHADHRRFVEAWEAAGQPGPRAPERHRAMHRARVRRDRSRVTVEAEAAGLPDGVFILAEDGAALLWQAALHPWTPGGGYGAPRPRPAGRVRLLTPAPAVAAFRAGYVPAARLGEA
ncbi:MAG: hypothetical protein AAFV86_08250 [Pseudomonadota bacterium]